MENQKISSFKDLKVWQKSIVLINQTYSLSKDFPANEKFGLTSQINRASVSIAANIAEGWGRESKKSFVQFLKISRGSLFELDTLLIIAVNQNYLKDSDYDQLLIQVNEIGKMINSLIFSIEKKLINDTE
ncbi:four helix bundle protein [Arcicella rosea]|uniref:Four helix bundle protein n=1 Tax=Arcicella rosea TaxID=502909 RepID=A0A841EP51_9BACT|nr:four helix bundle protein [Arcicella rosea]MBB6002060.1 four helix bundle protein [Arcicella rosea]